MLSGQNVYWLISSRQADRDSVLAGILRPGDCVRNDPGSEASGGYGFADHIGDQFGHSLGFSCTSLT